MSTMQRNNIWSVFSTIKYLVVDKIMKEQKPRRTISLCNGLSKDRLQDPQSNQSVCHQRDDLSLNGVLFVTVIP